MISITGLEKKFSSGFSLKIDELHIEKGDRVALLGLNGSGKSTLLRLIAGITGPDAGEIRLSVKKSAMCCQPQSPYAFRGSAEYNVRLSCGPKADITGITEKCMLGPLLKKKMSELSGGERQRVFLARTLAGNFDLLLLDEPFSAADLKTGETLAEMLLEECEKSGKTLLISTHFPRHAAVIANKILLLDSGRIAEYGPPSVMREPESDFGKEFFSLWKI
ncbi:MAG: ABC transporter ATP-binding protein [Clostridia bacterium]|nr:ABC transporter ATP-binding protein [Clostridia bacterium]